MYEKNTDTDTETDTETDKDTDEISSAENIYTYKKQYGKFSDVLSDDKQYEEMKKCNNSQQ